MTRYLRYIEKDMKISRFQLIRKLVRKEYKSVRPTAIQILSVIEKYGLNRYTKDGKKRSREVISKHMAKALNSLK
jgi:hypothetical protein